MSTELSSHGVLAIDIDNYGDISSNLDDFSDISYDQKNIIIDWHFPVIDLCANNQWLLFENNCLDNELCITEFCDIFKNKLVYEYQPEVFLQYPLVIQKLIKWLKENRETNSILECLNYFVEKLIKRHYECTNGLCENFESINLIPNSKSQTSITETNNETTTSDTISRWGIAKFCVSLMPITLKHISNNKNEAFSLFMSSMNLLSSITDSYNIKFYLELVFTNHTVKNIFLNEPLSSLKFLVIVKELLKYYFPNELLKDVIINILKQPYWIHLYPELFHQLYRSIINEELLELQIIKMVENTYTLSSNCNLDIQQYIQLFWTSLPILWFHQQFNLIDKFIVDTCKYTQLAENHNENEYSKILMNLLSFKSFDVVLYSYSALNKTVKKLFNNFNPESKKIDRLLNNLLCTNVLNEIICFGCVNSNEQICQLASEIMEQLLKSYNTIKNYQWKLFLNNLTPIFPVLFCYANKSSTFGQTVFDLFDPDQSEKFNISKLALLHSIFLMMVSKDKKSRIEANNRITWLLKTTLNKSIDLPNDIFIFDLDDLNEKEEDLVGEYTINDLNDMIDLISNACSSHQTIKCALYKISVMLEYSHLQQYFIQNGGTDIILNILKSSDLFVNERGLLIALLKLILCFTKKNKLFAKGHNLLVNNIEIQLHLVSVLSNFYEFPLVRQYILNIIFYCIFNQYLTFFGIIPKIVLNKLYIPIKYKNDWNSDNNYDDSRLFSKIKDNKNCMNVLILTWHLKHFNNVDLFLENGHNIVDNHSFNDIFHDCRKASVKWSVKKYLNDLVVAKSHTTALIILSDLKRYLELSEYIEQFEIDEELFKNSLNKFLVLPPIFSTDLQTLINVLRLLNFVLKKKVLINKLNWVADTLIKSGYMHHDMMDNFKNDESKHLCNQFFIELYDVYWLCLKNYNHFSTLNLTKLLFDQLPAMKNELVLLQVNMKCLHLLTENPKNVDKNLLKIYLSQFISIKTILMNNSNEKSLQQSYLIILNHLLHHTILIPNICEIWSMYDWELWTWSIIHSTDPLVRALIFQFSAGLAVIDIPVSHNLINLALNYFYESNYLENCVIAEQATIFCSNIFCNPKYKNLCQEYVMKLDLNVFVQIINMCSYYNSTKLDDKKYFLTSPKLVANICCMLFNMFTLTELNLHELDQNSHFVHALITCLKKYLTPIYIEKSNIMEMCGRICSILTLFVLNSSYSFDNLLTSLNLIYEVININLNLDHCTTMVLRSLFKLTLIILKCTNYKSFTITNDLMSVLLISITSKNNDLSIDALNVISTEVCSQLSKKFAHRVCKTLIDTLFLEWHHKLKRKMLLIALSNIFLEHSFTYETARQSNLLCFVITKIKIMQLQIINQSYQKSKTLQNDFLEIVGFCCNVFYGSVHAREDASAELPDLIHKLWPIVVSNPKSEILICTLKMLVSFTSNCPSACSAMTMTNSTLGVDPKMKITSYSLLHEVISQSSDFHKHGDIVNITLILLLNCCQSQECRVIITKSKLLTNIISVLNFKDKKYSISIEQNCLNFLLIFTSYNEGQKYLIKIEYILDTLVNLLKSNYKSDSLAILRNLCFNIQNRIVLLSSDVFFNGIKDTLERGNLTNQQYKDISLAIWSLGCNSQKARLQLRHWGIDKYFDKSSDFSMCDDETRNIVNCTYTILET